MVIVLEVCSVTLALTDALALAKTQNPASTDVVMVPVNDRLDVCDSPTLAVRVALPLRLLTSCTASTCLNVVEWLVTL